MVPVDLRRGSPVRPSLYFFFAQEFSLFCISLSSGGLFYQEKGERLKFRVSLLLPAWPDSSEGPRDFSCPLLTGAWK